MIKRHILNSKNATWLFVAVLLFGTTFFTSITHAEEVCNGAPLGACFNRPNSAYSFGEAKAHAHPTPLQEYSGFYCGFGLYPDSTNTEGNNFYGNTICVNYWASPDGPVWFWYDWGADFNAGRKHVVWGQAYPWQAVTIVYDPECKLAVYAYDPYNP